MGSPENGKLHWLWAILLTILAAMVGWMLGAINAIQQQMSRLGANQEWVIKTLTTLSEDLEHLKEMVLRHLGGGPT